MGILRHRRHLISVAVVLLFLVGAPGRGLAGIVHGADETSLRSPAEGVQLRRAALTLNRRFTIGPGSSPPTCRARCGWCFPCRPVHVAIEPGRSIPLEYYPEAWRCKCGDKLFMP